MVLVMASSMTAIFAEITKTPYDIVKSMWINNSEYLEVANVCTKEEATVASWEVSNIFDGITSGYMPRVKTSVTMNENKTATTQWKIKVTKEDLTELREDARIKEELEKLQGMETEKEKVIEINRFVNDICDYDYTYTDENINTVSETAIGALNGKAICQGYANLTSFLYDEVGIQNVKVRGYIKEGGGFHVWNVVELDGKYYVVDTTWNEQGNHFLLMSLDAYGQYVTSTMDVSQLFYLKYSAKADYFNQIAVMLRYMLQGYFKK